MEPHPDWPEIEQEYRAGVYSIREIGRRHGISDTAIRARARERAWERDLSDDVRRAARRAILADQAGVRTERSREPGSQTAGAQCAPDPEADAEIVEGATNTTVEVDRSHRSGLRRLRDLSDKLMVILEDLVASGQMVEQPPKDATPEQMTAWLARNNRTLLVLGRGDTAVTVATKLVAVMAKVVELERQVYGISTIEAPADQKRPPAPTPADVAAAAKAAFEESRKYDGPGGPVVH